MKNPEFAFINTPTIVEIFPTMQCNVHCKFCDRGEEKSIITDFSACKTLLDSLATDSLFTLKHFRLTGREPLLHPHINKLIAYIHTLAPDQLIEIFSNGLRVDILTEESLKKIALAIGWEIVFEISKARFKVPSTLSGWAKIVFPARFFWRISI